MYTDQFQAILSTRVQQEDFLNSMNRALIKVINNFQVLTNDNQNLERELSIGHVDIRRKPVQDSSDRVGVKECHRASHDPVQQLLVNQLRGRGAAQQEGQVHGDLEDGAAGADSRVDAQVLGRLVSGGVFCARVGPEGKIIKLR